MTDKEIRELAEKTRKENFCSRFTREYGCTSNRFPGSRCPMYKSCRHTDEWYNGCENTGYKQGFLDGFKAATEYIEKIIEKSKTPDDGFAYSAIHNDALNDIIKEIKTDKT